MLVFLVPIALAATASSRKKENDAIREVMKAISDARPALELRDAQRQKVLARYARACTSARRVPGAAGLRP